MPERPDARHVLANERTLLAWLRTAMALLAGGFAATTLLTPAGPVVVRVFLGVPLMLLGTLAAVGGYRRWSAANRALTAGEQEIPQTTMPLLLTSGIVVLGIVALLLTALGAV